MIMVMSQRIGPWPQAGGMTKPLVASIRRQPPFSRAYSTATLPLANIVNPSDSRWNGYTPWQSLGPYNLGPKAGYCPY